MIDRHRLTVIYYHSVGPVKPDWEKSFLTVSMELFEKHLVWLGRRYKTISPGEYLKIRTGEMPPVKNPLLITFDDGYLDNWVYAFPP
ncbi:MAG: hypothetical protein IPI37_13290 [Bacteroidales bacterium]|nr:hypothetical protein [Bacteroidales bacterium]